MGEIGRIIEAIFPGVKVMPMPDSDLINQLLKLSETDREKATKHLISLFNNDIVGKTNSELCKDFVEDYLLKPYLIYHPKDNHKLTTKEQLEDSKK